MFPCDDEDDCNAGSGSGLPPPSEGGDNSYNTPSEHKDPSSYPDPEGTDSSKWM